MLIVNSVYVIQGPFDGRTRLGAVFPSMEFLRALLVVVVCLPCRAGMNVSQTRSTDTELPLTRHWNGRHHGIGNAMDTALELVLLPCRSRRHGIGAETATSLRVRGANPIASYCLPSHAGTMAGLSISRGSAS